jgi:hypothetical protein
MDRERNNQVLKLVGIDKVLRLEELFGDEKISFKAVLHEHKLQLAEEGIRQNLPIAAIVELSGLSKRTIERNKIKYLGIKKPPPAFSFGAILILFAQIVDIIFDLCSLVC